MTTDTSERGLERLICTALAGYPCDPPKEARPAEAPTGYGGAGWSGGNTYDYDREFCVDLVQLAAFLDVTQPDVAQSLALYDDGPTRRKFLARLQGEITKRGTIEVLRHGVSHGAHDLDLFYGTPSVGNPQAQQRFAQNRFTVVRQLRYSRDETQRALDIALFINGLPVFTFELKNSLTKQTVADAVEQYKRDRNPREKLFELGRCVAHFAVDESDVRFCTHLKGKASWFLPFNRGWNAGAGNPPNPSGIKTDYLWREVLARESLADILENYAQVVEAKDEKTGKKKRTQIWPRYQQLDVVRRLLADAASHGAGRCYLIQHSAGSGKSNSIAWLAHQLIRLAKADAPLFDSIIVVTDRRILDRQIGNTIRQYAQVGATVGRAQQSGDLRRFIEAGKKIIISTVQKFPFILDEIGNEQRTRRFAIIVDEAHSSQGGRTSASISAALGTAGEQAEDETYEDQINRVMESRKLLANASYFAFTATPKNKTLEIFGEPDPQPDGAVRHHAFHSYTMKQAIQEGFILDVLAHYTPVASYYRLAKTVEDDPEFDIKKAQKKLRRFVEGHDHAIRLKAEIMVDHFHQQVIAKNKIGGEARAMVVTNGIERAIQYFHAIRDYLQERKSQFRAVVAFSGEPEFGGQKVTEASLNGFSSGQIAQKIQAKIRTASSSVPTSSRPVTTSRCCTRCTWTRRCPASRRCRRCRASTVHTRRSTTSSSSTSSTTPTPSATRSPTTTAQRSWPARPIPTSCTICRRISTPPRSTHPSRSTISSSATSAVPRVTSSIRSSTSAPRSTSTISTRMRRWTSRARPRPLCGPTVSCRACCPTRMPPGRSARSS